MNVEELAIILSMLKDLNSQLYSAERTKDKRRIDKSIRDAKNAISDFAKSLPAELFIYLERVVGANPMSYQHTGDIVKCIRAIEDLISNAEGQDILL